MKRLLCSLCVAFLIPQLLGASCKKPPRVEIQSPAHGLFTTASSVTVSGVVKNVGAQLAALTVNGVPATVQSDKSWSVDVPLDPTRIFQPILAELTHTGNGQTARDRRVVHFGDSRADGAFSEASVALRLSDDGLDAVEPLVSSLVNLDVASLLPVGTEVISNFCAIDGGFLGCLGRVDVFIANPPASFSGFGLNVDSMAGFAAGDVFVNDVRVDLDIDGSDLAPSCGLRVTASQVSIFGNYGLSPDAADPTTIDVNLLGQPGVSFTAFNDQFTSGLCDFPLIGDLIQLILGDIEPVVVDGLVDFLDDPDGGGPADAPLADGIETALAGIEIAGPIGDSLAVDLLAPLFTVDEDANGITLGSDSAFIANVGTGAGQCDAPAGAPDLAGSYHIDEVFPVFGPGTPVNGLPYGLGLSISTSAFNQLLKAQVECGLLVTSLTELALPPLIPDPTPITSDLLALFVPEFADLPAGTQLRIDIAPSLAPVVTGQVGPQGELSELRMAHLDVEVVLDSNGVVQIGGAVDADLGLDLAFDNVTSSLLFQLGTPTAAEVGVVILQNPLGADAAALEQFILPQVIALLLPELASDLAEFPLPDFLGLALQGVEVSRQGEFVSLFADLVPTTP